MQNIFALSFDVEYSQLYHFKLYLLIKFLTVFIFTAAVFYSVLWVCCSGLVWENVWCCVSTKHLHSIQGFRFDLAPQRQSWWKCKDHHDCKYVTVTAPQFLHKGFWDFSGFYFQLFKPTQGMMEPCLFASLNVTDFEEIKLKYCMCNSSTTQVLYAYIPVCACTCSACVWFLRNSKLRVHCKLYQYTFQTVSCFLTHS